MDNIIDTQERMTTYIAKRVGLSTQQIRQIMTEMDNFCNDEYEKNWEKQINKLKKLHAHGFKNIITEYEEIYYWICGAKERAKTNNLSSEKLEALKKLNLV